MGELRQQVDLEIWGVLGKVDKGFVLDSKVVLSSSQSFWEILRI